LSTSEFKYNLLDSLCRADRHLNARVFTAGDRRGNNARIAEYRVYFSRADQQGLKDTFHEASFEKDSLDG
jgi:hypothetical protein